MKNVSTYPVYALDLLFDIISRWKHLCKHVSLFILTMKEFVYPAVHTLLKRLHDEYSVSNGITPRIIRITRFLLHNYLQKEFLDELDLMVSLMVHSIQVGDVNESNSDDKTNSIDKMLSRLSLPLSSSTVTKPQGIMTVSNSRSALAQLPDGTTSGAYLAMTRTLSKGDIAIIPAHPAGLCIEALLSFLLLEHLVDDFSKLDGGASILGSVLATCLTSCSVALTEALSTDSNIVEFDKFLKDSSQVQFLEGILSGEEADVDHAVRLLYEGFLSAGSISANEVLLLSFQVVIVVSRLLTQCAIKIAINDNSEKKVFLPPELTPPTVLDLDHIFHPFLLRVECMNALKIGISFACEHGYETATNACVTILLSGIENARLIRRTLGIVAELGLTSGLLGLQRPCEVAISTLCKFSVPRWGHDERGNRTSSGSSDNLANPPTSPPYKWRHLQSFVRLVQVLHVLADRITDWDVIMDCFEQLGGYTQGKRKIEITTDELDKVLDCVNRFKTYSMNISDDTLLRLMTSLVALSLNSLAVSSAGGARASTSVRSTISSASLAAVMSAGVNSRASINSTVAYMADAIDQGLVGYSMRAAIEISKINSFRVSSVWQMVMSHLRMVASLKSSTLRVISVAATHDIIASTLECLLQTPPELSAVDEEWHPFMMSTTRLTDDILYTLVMPQLDGAFDPMRFQRVALHQRLKDHTEWPQLTQLDLFASLKSLASVRYDDVRKGLLLGLRSLLQGKGGGQIKGVGWVTIIELLILVPSSMRNSELDVEPLNEDVDNPETREQWPQASLETAFACLTLIVDDFLEELPDYAIMQGICCLASFGSQVVDVNISLTSVELLWKVTDHALSSTKTVSSQSEIDGASVSKVDLLNLAMTHLQSLSKDSRSEIRNCAVRTLFAAIVANSSLLSIESWRFVFDEILFPLLKATVEKSGRANNMQSDAPELKKGVKMTLHHSRDTASKQVLEANFYFPNNSPHSGRKLLAWNSRDSQEP